jgi:hypothetical protein
LAVCRLATATHLAGSVFAPEEPDSYTLANLPGRDAWTNLLDAANRFVARNTRINYSRELSLNGTRVRVTHTTSLNANADLSSAGRSNLSLHHGENARRRYFHCTICACHFSILSSALVRNHSIFSVMKLLRPILDLENATNGPFSIR